MIFLVPLGVFRRAGTPELCQGRYYLLSKKVAPLLKAVKKIDFWGSVWRFRGGWYLQIMSKYFCG